MPTTLLHSIQRLYTCDDNETILDDAWILVEGNVIKALGQGPVDPAMRADKMLDLTGAIVTPGLINIHHHFFQSITKALPFVQKSFVLDWLLKLYPLWVEIGPDEMVAATQVAAAELLLSGGTTSVDHSYMVPGADFDILRAQVETCRDIGLRLHLVVGSMPTLEGNLEEQLKPVIGDKIHRLIDPVERVYETMRRSARAFHDASAGSMTKVAFGPVGVTYTLPDMMRDISALAADYGCGLHTHLHPRPDEREKASTHLRSDPVAYLKASKWMKPGTWFAHCSQLTDDEMKVFADNGVGIAHCAHTIARLGFPLTRISAMRRYGVAVGIGVDGCASNDSGSILHDLRLALILHRIGTPLGTDTQEAWLSPYDALLMATRDGARIIGRNDIGRISVGCAADIAAFRLDRVGYAGSWGDPLSALLLAGCDPYAHLTMVNGAVVVWNGRLVNADETAIISKASQATRRIIDRAS
ncbi:amidohydrolase family protein [Roseiarcaceae bacterium H3SJ34-1]|uniref:amidohydrolase family protein n=1 Tax=Terripilifer ovatus TaxID=3032367 RepID=UPI003AB99FEF|nr:amidohydrolase family protein [Roseiarcaceae bacterium H3SJ34-1]